MTLPGRTLPDDYCVVPAPNWSFSEYLRVSIGKKRWSTQVIFFIYKGRSTLINQFPKFLASLEVRNMLTRNSHLHAGFWIPANSRWPVVQGK